jgi:hypothetical protein
MEYDCEGVVNIKFDSEGFATSEGTLTVYVTDDQGILVGSALAQVSEGTTLPARSYADVPPDVGENEVVMRSPDGYRWLVVPDLRGQTVYATDNSGPKVIERVGEIPPGYTLAVPQTAWDTWNGAKWVTDNEAQKQGQIALANAEKELRLAAANTFICEQNWGSKLTLGRLSDEGKALFNKWLDYTDALEALDTSTAPDVSWPEAPSS